jgi:hypothetical protein
MSNSLRDDLAAEPTHATRRALNTPKALAKLRDEIDLSDGYPTSVIGASPPEPGAFKLYRGTCQDWQFIGATKVRCEAERPCPEHDSHVPMTTVERAADRSGHLCVQHDQITVAARKWMAAGAHLDLLIAAHIERLDVAAEKCSRGTGRDGMLEWGDPLCERIKATDRGGLCDACAKREYRWRKASGLPSRDAA